MKRTKQRPELPIEEPIPAELDTEDFYSAWREWLEYRAVERRSALSPRAQRMALRRLTAMGPSAAVAAIEHSIAGGFRGIYPAPGLGKSEPERGRAGETAKGVSVWEAKERLHECRIQLEELVYPGGCATAADLTPEQAEEAARLRGEISRMRAALAGK